jgi:pimeloyl-ACP methyl ester carboxylesterase
MFRAMHKFNSGGVEIAYEVAGSGEPILLIHGFASTGRVNWWDTGWVKTLMDAGRRVITFDNRGHGQSQKLHDPAAYTVPEMARDAIGLLDHLQIPRADIMGYSMGARIAAWLAVTHPEHMRRAVLGGLASRIITGVGGGEAIAAGLEAATVADVKESVPRAFRIFAEHTKSDLKSLAACMRAGRIKMTAESLGGIAIPVLVVAGEKDDVAGSVDELVRIIPGAKGVILPGRNHMNAVGDRLYKQVVVEFLQ